MFDGVSEISSLSGHLAVILRQTPGVLLKKMASSLMTSALAGLARSISRGRTVRGARLSFQAGIVGVTDHFKMHHL